MTQKANYRSDALNFEVDAQLIRELGERLVSRNHIGISELIKNSYDADSPFVKVVLSNVTSYDLRTSELTIMDLGSGMSFDTVKNRWMIIGTSNKRNNPISPIFGRPVTGNKGIGRFACQRLAERLELETCCKTDQGYEYTKVQFEWDDFKPGVSLSNVNCIYETYTETTGEPGTTLRLKGLRERITDRDFKMILKSISLISIADPTLRKGFEPDPGFEVTISAPEFASLMGANQFKASKRVLSSGWGTLQGEINSNGTLYLTLESKDTELKKFSTQNDNYKALDGIKFEIFIIPLKARDSIERNREPTLLTSQKLKEIQEYYSGIKLYLNGFRVYPYGEVTEGDDWLGIAHDISRRRGASDFKEINDLAKHMGITQPTRAMLNHPGTRSLIGTIHIAGQAVESFEVKMDREGLVETQSFSNLKKVVRLALDWATMNYEAWLVRARNKQHQEKVKNFELSIGHTFEDDKSRFTKAIETLRSGATLPQTEQEGNSSKAITEVIDKKNTSNITALTMKLKEVLPNKDEVILKLNEEHNKGQIDTATDYAISQFDALSAELELLRAVSATAPLLFVFAHEVKGIAQTLLSQSTRLELIADKIDDPETKAELLNLASNADLYKQSFDDLFDLFDVFSDATDNMNKKITYHQLFQKVQTGLKFFLEQFDIELVFEKVNPTWKVPKLNQAEAYSILINLISNSIKSLIASDSEKRKINISITKVGLDNIILVKDNGIGLAKEHWETVFEARTFDPEGKLYNSVSSKLGNEKLSNLGKGSGLGLNIIRNILRKHKSDAFFIEPDENWKAIVQVVIGN
ncbi:ATP-binding protein [Vibrio cholerae]|uniref:ATP-binding protein n=1 Tax=Vibrio cholerae TaxID=666 RepID=UPI001E5DDD4D|nr:ATP-binding protein [Vibrio cholerae]MCD6730824.1 ATP-binding protein [Vibrio cholerae]MCX9556200.1 ATP-binding protein [Vibrio cholerae]